MIASPHQTFGWYSAWLATVGARRHHEPVIIVAYDEHDQPIAILPLVKRRAWGGLVLCEFAGGRHSNANFSLFAPSLSGFVDAPTMRWILHETNRQVGRVDAFCFVNMPLSLGGHESWMNKVGSRPSPSGLHATSIVPTFEEWQAAWLSPSRRKKLRQKLGYLSRLGLTRLVEASSPMEVERILAAFYRQKCQSFEQLGLDTRSPTRTSRTSCGRRRCGDRSNNQAQPWSCSHWRSTAISSPHWARPSADKLVRRCSCHSVTTLPLVSPVPASTSSHK